MSNPGVAVSQHFPALYRDRLVQISTRTELDSKVRWAIINQITAEVVDQGLVRPRTDWSRLGELRRQCQGRRMEGVQ